jgi:hypothetical protein
MQYPVDPALLGQQICQILATSFDREILLQIANTLGVACQADLCLVAAVVDQKVVNPNACWQLWSEPKCSQCCCGFNSNTGTLPNHKIKIA